MKPAAWASFTSPLRYAVALVVTLGALGALAPPSRAASPRYFTDLMDGRPHHIGYQGDGWELVFTNTVNRPMHYRVCLRKLTGSPSSRCWSRTASRRSRSVIFVALFVNDSSGPGRWIATWYAEGRQLGTWRFQNLSEGV